MSILSVFGKVESIFKSVAAAWPAVDSFVKQVEAALPGAIGSVKLGAVKSLIESTWNTVEGVAVDFESAWPALSAAVGALVTIYNAAGLFNHSATPPAA